jgi:DNA-directed RNA polymerase
LTLDAFQLAEDRYVEAEDRMIRDFGLGASRGAMSIIQRHIEAATTVVTTKMQDTSRRGYKELRPLIEGLEPSRLALVALQGALDAIASCKPLSKTLFSLGKLLEDEAWSLNLQKENEQLASRLDRIARTRAGSLKYRKQAVRSMARKSGYAPGRWPSAIRTLAGQWLVEVCLDLPEVFVLQPPVDDIPTHLRITEDALAYSQQFVRKLLDAHPVPLPLLSPPPAWTDTHLTLTVSGGSYRVPLVRTRNNVVKGHLKTALEDGRLSSVMEALSRIQETPWSINPAILDMVVWCQQHAVKVEGLPPAEDLELPEKLSDEEFEAMGDRAKRARRREVSKKLKKNRGFVGEREMLKRDIETARYLVQHGNQFWCPVNLDYRGRVYSTCSFNFQRQDYVRAMFQFHTGKALGPDGLYWLMVHVANTGDFNKVSKKPFEERIAWVKAHHDKIMETAWDPKGNLWWIEADAPMLFLAACRDYASAIESGNPSSYVSRIPVSFDGSCSGLQHFAAMTRCEQTAPLVNLTPAETVADVYQTVADKVKAEFEHQGSEVAQRCLEVGIDRKLVKRNVMTFSYSSEAYGMTDQHKVDTMNPLEDKVDRGELKDHPYALEGDIYHSEKYDKDVGYEGRQAAKLLGKVTYDCIEQTVVRPAEAMRFLQGIARTLAHEGKPVIWHTPVGLPVVLIYPNMRVRPLSLWLQDRGVVRQFRINTAEEDKGVDKKKAASAIAPGFVHSMDAAHLHMVVLAWQGPIALVHDSFGCHAADAGRFRKTIVQTFHALYSQNDVLQQILDAAYEQIENSHHRLPSLPEKGSYQIDEVLNAAYAFA